MESSASNIVSSPDKKKDREDKKNKFKVTYMDKVGKGQDLTRIHYVLSYKKYNALNTYDPFEEPDNENSSHCCTTF